MRLLTTAPAKLILVGEYAVVEGAPAVVAAIDRRVEVEILDREKDGWTYRTDAQGGVCRELHLDPRGRLVGGDGALAERDPATRLLAVAVETSLPRDAPPLPRGLDIAISSRRLYSGGDGQKLGLGSSAAVMVAVGTALRRRSACPGEGKEGLRLDLAAHRRLQGGRGSGADVASSTLGGVIRFQRDGDTNVGCRPLKVPKDLHMRCFWTGRSASTADFLALAEACREKTPRLWEARIRHLTALAIRASDAFESANTGGFLEALEEYAEGLRALGDAMKAPIVSEPHRALSILAKRCGAVYKPSGAGGGDIGIAFCDGEDELDRLVTKAAEEGYPALPVDIDPRGVNTLER